LVFVTNYRRGVLDGIGVAPQALCQGIEATRVRLLVCDGEDDHVHLLVEYPPKLSVSALVNGLKGTDSRLLRRDMPHRANRYRKAARWTPSYSAASAGREPLAALKRYMEEPARLIPRLSTEVTSAERADERH
jgi:putative transposase